MRGAIFPYPGQHLLLSQFLFIKTTFVRAFLGTQQNSVEGTEISHLPPASTYV